MKINLIIPAFFLAILSFSQNVHNEVDEYRNTGFFNITRIGYKFINEAKLETFDTENGVVVTSLPTDNAFALGLQTINGYFINPYISAGVGIGLDGYNNPNFNTLPLFIDVRGYFSDDASSLYAVFNYGTLLKIDGDKNNGSMLNLGVGYKFPVNDKRLMFVSDLSWSYKQISNDGLSIQESESWTLINGILVTFGIIF